MKLYAYRALDYVHAANATDRRHILFCAVQKAKVSTEGVRVMALLSECINAKGFESDTYFETALRDIQLIPGLEGSTHINLDMTAQFIDRERSIDLVAVEVDGRPRGGRSELPRLLLPPRRSDQLARIARHRQSNARRERIPHGSAQRRHQHHRIPPFS